MLKSLAENPSDRPAWMRLALFVRWLNAGEGGRYDGRYECAISDCVLAATNPKDSDAATWTAEALWHRRYYENPPPPIAVEFAPLLERYPTSPEAQNVRSLLAVECLDQHKYAEAAQIFLKLAEDLPSEGAFPKELPDMLHSLARTLAGKLKVPGEVTTGQPPPSPAFKPESLIMFYRGLNACARGQPELGVACFMNAESLDPDFAAPELWEIRAFDLGGFPEYAALRRKQTADTLKRLGLEAPAQTDAATHPAKPVLAVLAPVVAGGPGGIAPKSLASVLKDALLATGRVRLFAFEKIGDAVAEQDLRLSSLFTSEHAPRYGWWLASDAVVACRGTSVGTNRLDLDLALVNPLSVATLARLQTTVVSNELPAGLRGAALALLDQWMKSGTARASALPAAGQSDFQAGEETAELRPAYRGLAAALVQVRREPGNSGFHRALANALGATERPRLAAREIERCIETLNIHAPNADLIYLHTHRWLFWEPSPVAGCHALNWVDKRAITNLIQPLLTTYPESPAAGCMHYNLAIDDWHGTNWFGAAEHARHARQIMQPRPDKGRGDQDIIAAAYFLEGSSLRHLARAKEAKAVLQEGQSFMGEFKVQGFCLPLGPYIGDFFGPEQVYGFGGDRPDLRSRIKEELVLLEGKPFHPPGVDLNRDAREGVSATEAPSPTKADRLQRTEEVLSLNPTEAAARLSAGETNTAGATRQKLGQIYYNNQRDSDALDCYQRAVAQSVPLAQCPGAAAALVEAALENNPAQAAEEIERTRLQLGLPPVEASVVEWFAAGRKYQASRQRDLGKAVVCYRQAVEFLEHPGKGGGYHLEKQDRSERVALRWGPSLGEVDLTWWDNYDARWFSSAFYLAQCLIGVDRKEEAAQWLRRIALKAGGDELPLLSEMSWNSSRCPTVHLGAQAAQMLKELHEK